MNYSIDRRLDDIIYLCLKDGIKQYVKIDEFSIMVMFNNGIIMDAWNENRYYAWLNKCEILYPNDSPKKFKEVRVKRKTMVKLLYSIDIYKKNLSN